MGSHRFHGVWCASVTPLEADLSVDVDVLASHVGDLLDAGCHGVALFGSTGEGNSFTIAERADTLDALAERGLAMDRVLVGAGACAAGDVATLGRRAAAAGAGGLLLLPPFYYSGVSDDGLFRFVGQAIDGMGPAPLPIVLYHFPKLAGVGYAEPLVARLHEQWPDIVVGIKDSSGDLDRMLRLATGHPALGVLAGTERLLLPLVDQGGAGCLTATTNLTAALARRVYEDREPDRHNRLVAARTALESAPFVPGIKHLLAIRTGMPSWLRIRPPLEPLEPGSAARLVKAARAAPSDDSA